MGHVTETDLRTWRADPVAFSQTLTMRRPDGTTGPPQWSARQASWLRALAARDEKGAPLHRTVAVVGPKRCGKTLASAVALLWSCLWPDRLSVALANSREGAEELGYREALRLLKTSPLASLARDRRGRIEFDNGSTVMAVPCNAATVAGLTVSGLLVSDELWSAVSPDPYRLLSSQASSVSSQVLLVSQTSGTDSDVYRLYMAAQRGEAPRTWVDYIGPSVVAAQGNPNPYLGDDYLAERRAQLPDALYRQYMLGEWGSAGNAFVSAALVAACDADYRFPQTREEFSELGCAVVGSGLDRAQPFAGRDQSVWVTVGQRDGTFYVLACSVLPTGSEGEVLAEARRTRDVCGPHRRIIEAYQSADIAGRLNAELRHATSQAQSVLFGRLHRLMAEGRLKWPRGPEGDILRRQVTAFTVDTSSAQPRFSGGSGAAVDDAVYALGWALEAADQRRRVARIILPTAPDEDTTDDDEVTTVQFH